MGSGFILTAGRIQMQIEFMYSKMQLLWRRTDLALQPTLVKEVHDFAEVEKSVSEGWELQQASFILTKAYSPLDWLLASDMWRRSTKEPNWYIRPENIPREIWQWLLHQEKGRIKVGEFWYWTNSRGWINKEHQSTFVVGGKK